MATIFANILKVLYYEHVLGSSTQQLLQYLRASNKELGVVEFLRPSRKRASKGKKKEVNYVKGDYKGKENQFQSYHTPNPPS